MRLVLFVVVGAVIGLVIARMRSDDNRSRVDARPAPSAARSEPSARTRWLGPVQAGNVLQVDLQPTDTRYDAFLLARQNAELSAKEIFDSEPRDPRFAPTLEKRMNRAVETALRELDLDDKVQRVQAECKTLSCYTRIEVSKEHGWEVYNAINGVMFGDLQEPGIDESDPERTYVTVGNLYRASARDDAEYEKFQSEGMRPSLDAAKQRTLEAHRAAEQEAPR